MRCACAGVALGVVLATTSGLSQAEANWRQALRDFSPPRSPSMSAAEAWAKTRMLARRGAWYLAPVSFRARVVHPPIHGRMSAQDWFFAHQQGQTSGVPPCLVDLAPAGLPGRRAYVVPLQQLWVEGPNAAAFRSLCQLRAGDEVAVFGVLNTINGYGPEAGYMAEVARRHFGESTEILASVAWARVQPTRSLAARGLPALVGPTPAPFTVPSEVPALAPPSALPSVAPKAPILGSPEPIRNTDPRDTHPLVELLQGGSPNKK